LLRKGLPENAIGFACEVAASSFDYGSRTSEPFESAPSESLGAVTFAVRTELLRECGRFGRERQMKEVVQPVGAHRPQGAWSQGVRVGQLLFVSGQVGEDENGVITHPEDMAIQTTMALNNLARVVEAAGGSRADVVKVTAFITKREDFPAYDRVRRDFFGEGFPASTSVITDLVNPDYLIEIEAVAVLGGARTVAEPVL
jgi:2-iminobutanoate/2-iminopropanoate deaminase